MMILTTDFEPGLIPVPCKMRVDAVSESELRESVCSHSVDGFIYNFMQRIPVRLSLPLSKSDSIVVPFLMEAVEAGVPSPSDGTTYYVLLFRKFSFE